MKKSGKMRGEGKRRGGWEEGGGLGKRRGGGGEGNEEEGEERHQKGGWQSRTRRRSSASWGGVMWRAEASSSIGCGTSGAGSASMTMRADEKPSRRRPNRATSAMDDKSGGGAREAVKEREGERGSGSEREAARERERRESKRRVTMTARFITCQYFLRDALHS